HADCVWLAGTVGRPFPERLYPSPAPEDVGRAAVFALSQLRLRVPVVRQQPGHQLADIAGTLPEVRSPDQHEVPDRRGPHDAGVPAALVAVRVDAGDGGASAV